MVKRVCKAIARILALALDLDADYFDTPEMLANPVATLRLLHYEGELFNMFSFRFVFVTLNNCLLSFYYVLGKSDPSKGIYACGAHTDYGMMTLLATDGVMGLQVFIILL